MTAINTQILADAPSAREGAKYLKRLAQANRDAATAVRRGRSESEEWTGKAADAFRGLAERTGRDTDELARITDKVAPLWGSRVALLDELGRLEEARSFTKTDAGKFQLEAIASGDYSRTVDLIEANLKSLGSTTVPDGFAVLRLAVLRSKTLEDPREAADLIDAVRFTKGDLPWLEDMRNLALCELARRSGDTVSEASLVSRFLVKQPLLFELNLVFDFELLAYQRELRHLVQESLKKAAA